MKNYNKILEAVNRGIQLALDDFEDNELNSSLSQHNDIIDSEDIIKKYIEVNKEIELLNKRTVDLGLPSGTLWCKYNLGVNPNQLLTSNDWNGKYYAWGELKPKNEFTDKNYKFFKYSFFFNTQGLTKYVYNNEKHFGYKGFTDDLHELQQDDDAASKHFLNDKYHIPSEAQWKELQENTIQQMIHDYNGIKNLDGILLTSEINRNTIFIPLACCYDSNYKNGKEINPEFHDSPAGTNLKYGIYWTSNLEDSKYGHHNSEVAKCMEFGPGGLTQVSRVLFNITPKYDCMQIWSKSRICGCSIRPVYSETKNK